MAYGARLESVLGASPRGFESPILRSCDPSVLKGWPEISDRVAHLLPQSTAILALEVTRLPRGSPYGASSDSSMSVASRRSGSQTRRKQCRRCEDRLLLRPRDCSERAWLRPGLSRHILGPPLRCKPPVSRRPATPPPSLAGSADVGEGEDRATAIHMTVKVGSST